MFDAQTTSLIQSAAPLDGLDLEKLPQQLTYAYSQVVVARLRLSSGGFDTSGETWLRTRNDLVRLAETYEGLTIFLSSDDVHRPGSAFIAGSAHATLYQMELVTQAGENGRQKRSLTTTAVGSDVAAALLFLTGGQQADAAESAKWFDPNESSPHKDYIEQLLRFIAALASGQGSRLLEVTTTVVDAPDIGNADYFDAASQIAWHELCLVVQEIAQYILGEISTDPRLRLERLLQRLEKHSKASGHGDIIQSLRLPLAGPYHLARLLSTTLESLLSSAVTNTPPPAGIDDAKWREVTSDFASRRPILWRNHKKALTEGFLEAGTSFVVTFPTGAGKTTITELRIAAALLRGQKVVYLAPTKALIQQVKQDLTATVQRATPRAESSPSLEDIGERAGDYLLIQTPEQLLALLTYHDDAYRDIGLVVVDECHQLTTPSLSNGDGNALPDRRSIDAMWAVLTLLQRSPDADVILISAMVRNGAEIVTWLHQLTGRPATLLDLEWKPTRQVRGTVAYRSNEVERLREVLKQRRSEGGRSRKPLTADKSSLEATPIGLFCHTQIWDTSSTFAAFPLLTTSVPLSVNPYWQLTPNRNEVAGRLLGAMALTGMRPLVFSQQVNWTVPIARSGAAVLRAAGKPEIVLTEHEKALFEAAALELGGPKLVEYPVGGRVGIHHGRLLASERAAMESAFQRDGGLLALVATPTVAQGINLPAEAVIIAGDDRWVPNGDTGRPEVLAVHEVLNAAGRAGRAGRFAHGVVVDIPKAVFSVSRNEQEQIEFDGLEHVMSLFGTPDQCLDIVDPITHLLDRIQQGVQSDIGNYLLCRIGAVAPDHRRMFFSALLGNAFRSDREERVQRQLDAVTQGVTALESVGSDEGGLDLETWRELAGRAGVAPIWLARIAAELPHPLSLSHVPFSAIIDMHTKFLTDRAGMLFGLIDPGSADLDRILPRRTINKAASRTWIEGFDIWETRWRAALKGVLPAWLRGDPLDKVGAVLLAHRNNNFKRSRTKDVELGRRFALQASSGIGYGVSLVSRVIERLNRSKIHGRLATLLRLVSSCVREGFDHPDKLFLFWCLRGKCGELYPRVRVHELFDSIIDGRIPPWSELPDVSLRQQNIAALVEDWLV